jgi:hypothetical protein
MQSRVYLVNRGARLTVLMGTGTRDLAEVARKDHVWVVGFYEKICWGSA